MATTAVVVSDHGSPENAPAQIAIDSALALAGESLVVVYFCAVGPVDPRLARHPRVRAVCTGQPPLAGDKNRVNAALRGLWNQRAARAFRQTLAGLVPKATVLHFHLWSKALSPSIFGEAARFGAPVFITAHEYYLVCPNGGLLHYPTGAICRVRPGSVRCVCAHCDRRARAQKLWRVARHLLQYLVLRRIQNLTLLAPSHLSRNRLTHHLPGQTIHYHPNFVRTLPGADANIPFEQNQGYLFIGRLEPEKGIELFCRALAELRLPGVAIGAAESPGEAARLRTRWPGVRFTGPLPWEGIARHVAAARALVFPSLWHEGMGLVPFEVQKNYAMPCLVAGESAPRQLVRPGETGLLFRTGDVADLKRAITAMQDDELVRTMRQNIAAADYSEYRLENHVAGLLKLYRAAGEGAHG